VLDLSPVSGSGHLRTDQRSRRRQNWIAASKTAAVMLALMAGATGLCFET